MVDENDTDDWASAEFGEANLGDARLAQRLVALARRLACSPQESFPQSLKPAELKAAYRFFDNTRVDTDGVLAPHIAQTLGRMRQVPVVLAVQDTTEFNLSHLPATVGLGYGSGRHEHGFMMHSLLAVTPEGLPLGVLGMKTWVRPEEELGKKHQRKARPIAEKESIKWIEGIEHLGALKARCAETRLVAVGDRESDLYELFASERPDGVDWLVRAASNRCVRHSQEHLWETVQACAPLGSTDLLVPARGSMPQRTARLTLRCAAVRLRPPRARASHLNELDVFAIHAIEQAPPHGVEPLEWMLLSSVPTTTLEEVLERLTWYARRWMIESWHRVLKSGCQVEARQFGSLDRFVRATALFAVISWRILYATLLARIDTDLSCDVLLQPVEWRALYCHTHSTTQLPNTRPRCSRPYCGSPCSAAT
ncbi:IS4 family transposase [Paraburkholderia sp. EG304]|uniref:IS4 family transposase n=1 Tax=Paraburkholderia sp. EG304 TaxID=3237015 RepID=UPI00397A4093